MIFVERTGDVPASLSAQATVDQATAATEFYKTWVAGKAGFGQFTRYREYDVKVALQRIFKSKCAYCEKKLEKGFFEVEHYRPKASAIGDPHPGYWWLALRWSNLLPTCPGCNKGLKQHIVTADMNVQDVEALQSIEPYQLNGKANQFPVGGPRLVATDDDHEVEQPYIIDPTRTDPGPELSWRNDAAFSVLEPSVGVAGPSVRGEETIRCLALNRVELVQARTAILTLLRSYRTRILDDLEQGATEHHDPIRLGIHIDYALKRVDDMRRFAAPDQPFSAMAQAFVDDVAEELRRWLAVKTGTIDA
ncbi:hypothetical protein [uncultured Sphingomonas sp.]|uniref:hypothetical protein n=1 Tax=uncultured Sphingomonas sp. TaxID=158754 RepID=UPI0025866EA4|nr:hypothetical protein [uncultured Sphingomonas sp.]